MSKPQLDKNIPIPDPDYRRQTKYAWMSELEVGDSFVLEETKRYQMQRTAKRLKMKIRCSQKNQDAGMIRVWRVE